MIPRSPTLPTLRLPSSVHLAFPALLPLPALSRSISYRSLMLAHTVALYLSAPGVAFLGRVSLPNLEYYEGDANFILAIDNVIGLKEVRLVWNSDDVPVDRIIIAVTKSDLPVVFSHIYFDGPSKIVTSLSKHMPKMETLRLEPLKGCMVLLAQDTIHRITECLQQLTSLVYFEIFSYPEAPGEMAEDLKTTEGWGEACATLKACCFSVAGGRSTVDEKSFLSVSSGYLLQFPIQATEVSAVFVTRLSASCVNVAILFPVI
ncbi:hypothetical protein C8R45DRAFT_1207642 [Mycena sanguinolenta]|nr:hypothetical protein C8R45DRAFT_1207642 [Mycena sanguinolenta]